MKPVFLLAVLTPDQFVVLALAWIAAVAAIVGPLFALILSVVGKVTDLKKQVDTHGDRIHDLALNAQPPASPSPAPPVSKVAALIVAILLPALLFSGCGTTAGISVANFLESPVNQQIINAAAQAGAGAIVASAGSKLAPDQQALLTAAAAPVLTSVGTGTAWAIGEALRTQQGTPAAANATALTASVASQSGVSTATAAPIATAVQQLAATGVSADTANEAIARTVQSVAASKSGAPGPVGTSYVPARIQNVRPRFRTSPPSVPVGVPEPATRVLESPDDRSIYPLIVTRWPR